MCRRTPQLRPILRTTWTYRSHHHNRRLLRLCRLGLQQCCPGLAGSATRQGSFKGPDSTPKSMRTFGPTTHSTTRSYVASKLPRSKNSPRAHIWPGVAHAAVRGYLWIRDRRRGVTLDDVTVWRTIRTSRPNSSGYPRSGPILATRRWPHGSAGGFAICSGAKRDSTVSSSTLCHGDHDRGSRTFTVDNAATRARVVPNGGIATVWLTPPDRATVV